MLGEAAIRVRAFGAPAFRILEQGWATRPLNGSLLQSSAWRKESASLSQLRSFASFQPGYSVIRGARWSQPASPAESRSTFFAARKILDTVQPAPSTAILHRARVNLEFRSSFSTTNLNNDVRKPSPTEKPTKNLPDTPEIKHKSLYDRLPHIPQYHRPTKEELLAAATGFWSRLKVRFKWFSIRSVRPFSIDEIFGLFSWLVIGNLLWIILGTTTFVSLLILTLNTVFAQETLARWVGNYLTKSSGVKVVFESAIVPKWRGGSITFQNVFISRRPSNTPERRGARVSKGSPETAAAAAAATDHSSSPKSSSDEDSNFMQFDLRVDEINAVLSFTKWLNGQGLLSEVDIKGVRGVIDRTHIYDTGEELDPKAYRHTHNPGDFEIDSFKMTDCMVTVHQPNGFRPFTASIFSCSLPKLRQQWLLYDFLCADNVSGSYDDSLFTIHPRQLHRPVKGAETETSWQKQSRLRIDALKIEHLNRGIEGPFSWIHKGTVDLIADVVFPSEDENGFIAKFLTEFKNTRLAISNQNQSGLSETIETFMAAPSALDSMSKQSNDRRLLLMDLRVNFHDVRAAVPLLTRDLSYVNNALIRPIVGYINSRNTFIPINCRLAKRLIDFDGSWNLWDSQLLENVSAETYNAIVHDIYDNSAQIRRLKKVGVWSIQLALQALFMGMAGIIA